LDEAAPLETSADEKGRAKHIQNIQKATREFLRTIEQSEAHPYYAFLLADGDRMGKALDYAGEEALQRRIAAALDGFSLECEGIVATHGGSLIYAGGDDVLALLPLHSALQCANALRLKFGEALAFLTKESATLATLERNAAKAEDKFQAPTLSVGLALAHHMDPMSDARRWAQDAEKLAKQERNSLAVAMHKRSGAILKVAGQWDVLFPLHERLAHWVHLLAHQELPDRVAFEIEDALRIWEVSDPEKEVGDPEKDAAKQGDPQASVASLLSRAVSRRRKDQGAGNTEIEEEPRDLLVSLFGDGQDAREAGRRLSAELQIARLFLAARDAAFGRIEGRSE
jgi:CRISPR-associated protein Cmr2